MNKKEGEWFDATRIERTLQGKIKKRKAMLDKFCNGNQ